MDNFGKFFYCKLYDKETIEKWDLPKKVTEKINFEENNYFLLAIPQEEHHEGHSHVHFTIYPTKYEKLNVIEVEIVKIKPKLFNMILELFTKSGYDIIMSTMSVKNNNKYIFAVFFTMPNNENLNALISNIKKLKNVEDVLLSSFTCEGQCED